jgi:hypothetical protein
MARRITRAEANYRKGLASRELRYLRLLPRPPSLLAGNGRYQSYGLSDVYRAERNPFGKTLTPNEIVSIRAMAAR